MDHTNQDIVSRTCARNDTGELALTDEDKMKARVEHYARLLSVGFEWLSNELTEVSPTAGPLPVPVSVTLIYKALRNMKCGKATIPPGKLAGDERVQMTSQLVEAVYSCSVISSIWE